jgi:NADH-quinone oxidoreductase subunit N
MTDVSYATIFKALGSEILVVFAALVALSVDLVTGRTTETAARSRLASAVAAVGVLMAMFPLLGQFGQVPQTLMDGVLVTSQVVVLFKCVILALAAVTFIMSMYTDVGRHVGEYYALMLFAAAGMMLMVGTEDLLTLFVALELTSICLYVLTAMHKGALKSQEAAIKYFMFGAIASAFLLFGLSLVYGVTGTTNMRAMADTIRSTGGGGTMLAGGMLLLVVGFGFKVAVVPFHLWAPDAYEGAPTPVTALIATGSKVASFFVLTKLMMVGFADVAGSALWGNMASGWTLVLAIAAASSMILGNVAAIVQTNVKRLLAYSSVAHAGYILVGLVAATEMGAVSVLFYVIVYALTNLGAFGVVSALADRAGGETLSDFNGMARRAPVMSLLMLVFMLSLAGIPPLGGFFGKFYLFSAAIERDASSFGLLWLVALGIAMSAVSLYYYLVVLKHMYVEPAKDSGKVETPPMLVSVLTILAGSVLAMGLVPDRILALLNYMVAWL